MDYDSHYSDEIAPKIRISSYDANFGRDYLIFSEEKRFALSEGNPTYYRVWLPARNLLNAGENELELYFRFEDADNSDWECGGSDDSYRRVSSGLAVTGLNISGSNDDIIEGTSRQYNARLIFSDGSDVSDFDSNSQEQESTINQMLEWSTNGLPGSIVDGLFTAGMVEQDLAGRLLATSYVNRNILSTSKFVQITDVPEYILTVNKTGSGTVTSSPSGINCGSDCTETFTSGTPVRLTATPSSGYSVSWSGCSSTSGNRCDVSMNSNKTVTATFTEDVVNYTLTVNKTGSGTVTSSPSGINCGSDCTETFTSGTPVRLTATPSSGYSVSWSGCSSTSGNRCDVSMNSNKTVTATFTEDVVNYRLTVNKTGSGTVTSSPSGINCGSDCSETFTSGTPVRLTATPSSGYSVSWSGCNSISGNRCDLVMDSNKSPSVIFSPEVTSTPGSEKWSIKLEGSIVASPAIANDGTVYVSSTDYLYAIEADGSLKWTKNIGDHGFSNPLVSNGVIYKGSINGGLYAIDNNGGIKWLFETSGQFGNLGRGSDGTIYAGIQSSRNLYAIDAEGRERWSFHGGAYSGGPAIGLDSTIYIGSYTSKKLYAIDNAGNVLWSFNTEEGIYSSPAIGSDGTIYTGSKEGELYAINPDGSSKWSFQTGGSIVTSPAIAVDGTIYIGSRDDRLYAINRNGSLKWFIQTDGDVVSSAAIDANGTVYFGSEDGNVYAVSSQGELVWTFATSSRVKTSPAISDNNTIYIASLDGTFYAINSDAPLSDSPWPKVGFDNQNTAATDLESYVYELLVNKTGSGTVTSSPSGINCGSDCSETFTSGTPVRLTATPSSGYSVTWSGCSSTSGNRCDVSMNSNKTVTATFTEDVVNYRLTVNKTGSGTVTSSPSGINCGSDCTETFTSGTSVILTATPSSGYSVSWSGCNSTSGNRCDVSMSSNKNVTATFTEDVVNYTLTVNKAGSGTVISSPSGINCGSDCTETFTSGTPVRLTATPSSGYSVSWSGCNSTSGNRCDVSMSRNKTVTATFTEDVVNYTLTVNKTGSGTVTSSPSGINCGSDCTETFTSGTSVILTATPSSGYSVSWSGCSSTSGNRCDVSMNSNKTVIATFTEDAVNYMLIVDRRGRGAVVSSPQGIDCGTDCWESFSAGEPVRLTANPVEGYKVSWIGCSSISGNRCDVSMSSNKNVTATFTEDVVNYTLTVNKAGSGTVISSPSGINCGSDCTETFTSGTSVILTATPSSGYSVSWSGCSSTSGNRCDIVMNSNKSPSANFSPNNDATPGVGKWVFTAGGQVYSSPAIGSDGTVYFGSFDKNLYAINENGSKKWEFSAEDAFFSSPALSADGTVVIASSNVLYAINADGKLNWSYTLGDSTFSSPAVAKNGSIYIGADDQKLYALNHDGSLQWTYETGGNIFSSPTIGKDGTIFVGSEDHKLYAINADGTQKWSYLTDGQVFSSPALSSDGTIYIGSDDGNLYSINDDGRLRWKYKTEGIIRSSPSIGEDGTVYVGSSDEKIYAITGNGNIKWSYSAGAPIISSPTVGQNGIVYANSMNGNLYALNPDGTSKWSYFSAENTFSSPAIGDDGTIYFGAEDGNLHAVHGDTALGNSTWPKFGQNNANTSSVEINKLYHYLDFDMDGKADIVFRRPDNGFQYAYLSNSKQITREFFGSQSNDIPITGDFDGDAIPDTAVFRISSGTWLIKRSSDKQIFRLTFGVKPSDMPVPADYDGDGKTDIAIFRKNTGQWIIRPSSAPSVYQRITFGTSDDDIPIPADYDGDGKVDIAVRRAGRGLFIIRQSSNSEIVRSFFGSQSTDVAVPADYDGDGKADIAIRRPNTGFWFVRFSSDNIIYRAYFGSQATDIPVPADYDGDGKFDLAIRRPSSGFWFVRHSENGQIFRVYFGSQIDDIPVGAPFLERSLTAKDFEQLLKLEGEETKINGAWKIYEETSELIQLSTEEAIAEGIVKELDDAAAFDHITSPIESDFTEVDNLSEDGFMN